LAKDKPVGKSRMLDWQVGDHLGVSEWTIIDQDKIDGFGKLTDDIEPLHNDPIWCIDNSPYGKTISYGFLTLSLLTKLINEATDNALKGTETTNGYPLNYGFDKIRFLAPVVVDSEIRCSVHLKERQLHEIGELFRFDISVEVNGMDKPVLFAEWLAMWVDN
jgi:acyl dehydratase